MAASVRGPSGYVAADARRGSISVGAREIPFTRVAAVEVAYASGDTDTPSSYGVALALAGGEALELSDDTRSFGDARRLAVEFARECGLPIRDRSLGSEIVRRWEDWETPLAERHRGTPPPRPPSHPPGDELTYDVSGMAMIFHARPGSFRRIWNNPGRGQKTSILQWTFGLILLPIFLVLFIPLIPFLAVAYLVVRFRTGGKGPLLEVSAEGVRHRALTDEWIPAGDVRDVDITHGTAGSDPGPNGVVVRSDTVRIHYAASTAGAAELEWLRDWVRALVCGG